jgi:hypothetical protein
MRLLFAAFLIFSVVTAVAAQIVSESVGQVGERILTSREVQISAVIEHVLEPLKGETGLYQIRPGDANFSSEVTALLLETSVGLEAESFNVGQVSDATIKSAVEKVEKAVKGKAYWEGLEVTAAELRRQVSQKLIAKNFIKFKTDSMSSIISEREARDYYQKSRMKFDNVPYASLRDNIKSYLAREQLKERLRSWFELIKRKYKVRNFLTEGKS